MASSAPGIQTGSSGKFQRIGQVLDGITDRIGALRKTRRQQRLHAVVAQRETIARTAGHRAEQRLGARPWRRAIAIASASAATFWNSSILFSNFTNCPLPTGPQCVMSLPRISSSRRICANTSSDAPTMMLNSPRDAASLVRATGARRNRSRRAASRARLPVSAPPVRYWCRRRTGPAVAAARSPPVPFPPPARPAATTAAGRSFARFRPRRGLHAMQLQPQQRFFTQVMGQHGAAGTSGELRAHWFAHYAHANEADRRNRSRHGGVGRHVLNHSPGLPGCLHSEGRSN